MAGPAKNIIWKYNGPFVQRARKWLWEGMDFKRYGMLFYDNANEAQDDVAEAVRRLAPHEHDARQFRLMRAANLLMNNEILPKDQWTKYEDENWYLKPYLDEVWREVELQKRWTGLKHPLRHRDDEVTEGETLMYNSSSASAASDSVQECFWIINPSTWPPSSEEDLILLIHPCQPNVVAPSTSSGVPTPPALNPSLMQSQPMLMAYSQQPMMGFTPHGQPFYYFAPQLLPANLLIRQERFEPERVSPEKTSCVQVREEFYAHLLRVLEVGGEDGVRMRWGELQACMMRWLLYGQAFFRSGLRFGDFEDL